MGNLTAKTSGEIASFMSPSVTNIKSLKVHFSPKQLGTGDPSPENVRGIEGWDGVEVAKSSINLLDQSYITNASGWALSSDDGNTMYCGVPVYKGNVNKFYTKFKSGYPFIGNPFKENVQYNVSVWLKTVDGGSLQGLKFGFRYTDGTSSLHSIFSINGTWKRQTLTSKADKTVSGVYCSYNSSGEIYLCGLAVCEKEFDDINIVHPSIINNISIDWLNDIGTIYGGYIDLISGELVEEYSYLDLSNLNWDVTSQVGVFRSDDLTNYYVSSITNFICNKYTTTSKASTSIASMQDLNIKAHDVNDKYIYIKDTGYTDVTEFKSSLIDCNMVYLLATPIIHQLTPTQLQSFVGQNNFWSNADYVEVEYDLIETIDIQKARQKIILNQPQLKTISDKVVSFNTDMVAPMKNCKIYFKPIQLGSGDPSPTNVRDINGWTGVDSYVNGDKISVDWTSDVGTVYGGYLDLAKKEVVAEWECNQLTSAQLESYECGYSSNVSYFNTSAVWIRNWNYKKIGAIISGGMDGLCNMFPISIHNKNIYASQYRIYFKVPNTITSLEDFKTNIQNAENNNNGLFIAYKLATPIHYPLSSLTSQQLLTIKGWNNYWSNVDTNLEVKYWTHKIPVSESNIAYVGENLTFDGTVNSIIDTGIYLFNEENINRDFEVIIEGLYGNDKDSGGANTVICAKHNGNAYGFLVRINSNSNATYNGTIAVKINYNNTLVIKRVDGVISVNGDSITNPKVKFTNAVHQWSLVLGCAIDDNGTYYRFSKGSIKRIIVRWL